MLTNLFSSFSKETNCIQIVNTTKHSAKREKKSTNINNLNLKEIKTD